MKKKVLLLSVLLVFGVTLFGQIKIGIINPNKVIQQTIKGKKILEEIKKLSLQKEQKQRRGSTKGLIRS